MQFRSTRTWNPALLTGSALLLLLVATDASTDEYLDALTAEAADGGASIDGGSVAEVSTEELESDLQQQLPTIAEKFSKLPPDQQAQVLNDYSSHRDIYKVSSQVLRLSRAPKL